MKGNTLLVAGASGLRKPAIALSTVVIPAKAGIQLQRKAFSFSLGPGFRRDDAVGVRSSSHERHVVAEKLRELGDSVGVRSSSHERASGRNIGKFACLRGTRAYKITAFPAIPEGRGMRRGRSPARSP